MSSSNSALSIKVAKMGPSWADLPAELITLVCAKASTTILQYVHLRVVCKPWRRALTPSPHHLPPQAPWLMFPRLSVTIHHQIPIDELLLSFYDLSQSKIHCFQLPYLTGKYLLASYYGWLVLEHDQRVSLHNSITRSTIDLPPLNAPPTIFKVATSESNRSLVQCYQHCVYKVVLSCNPSEPGCVVVAWFPIKSNWELGFCRIGDTQWTVLKMRNAGPHLLDFTCHNNSVYTVNMKKEVSVYDLQSLAVMMFPSKINYSTLRERINFVEVDAEFGGPLVVKRLKTSGNRETKQIYLYQWFGDQKQWLRVRDIGKRVMFLSESHCTIMQLEKEKGNEIYYEVLEYLWNSFHVDIYRMNLKSGIVVPHNPSPVAVFPDARGLSSWFTPSLM